MGCGQSNAAQRQDIPPAAAATVQPDASTQPAPAAAAGQPPASSTTTVVVVPDQPTSSTASAPPASSQFARQLDEAAALELQLREQPAMSTIPAEHGAATAAPAWQSFTTEQLDAIEKARAEVRAKGPLVMDPKSTYGLICRACTKPNSTNVTFCTGCSFPSTAEDIQQLPSNIFLELVQGKDIGATVRYRDADTVAFDDKFPVSDNHLDIIPTVVYLDVTVLTKEHIPMLERLYEVGKKEFLSRNIGWLQDQNIDELITAGYNYPVSVKHLHLHLVLPPFRHEKVFQYPRWHSHAKVVRDLKEHGKVHLYCDQPNDEEGNKEYQRAMANSEKAKKLAADWEEKHKAAAK